MLYLYERVVYYMPGIACSMSFDKQPTSERDLQNLCEQWMARAADPQNLITASRKHAYMILTPLNPTFI